MKKSLLLDPPYPSGTVAESPPQQKSRPEEMISGEAGSLRFDPAIGPFHSPFASSAGQQRS
ncbi:hypothetical protein [Larkinella sp.]|uniref:hypothetical protein n=1 Tax=Larkinella sp. TaxID=2034517 RepID=UPI003BACB467